MEYTICKYLLPLHRLPFHFVDSFSVQNFLVLYSPILFIFAFVSFAYRHIQKYIYIYIYIAKTDVRMYCLHFLLRVLQLQI